MLWGTRRNQGWRFETNREKGQTTRKKEKGGGKKQTRKEESKKVYRRGKQWKEGRGEAKTYERVEQNKRNPPGTGGKKERRMIDTKKKCVVRGRPKRGGGQVGHGWGKEQQKGPKKRGAAREIDEGRGTWTGKSTGTKKNDTRRPGPASEHGTRGRTHGYPQRRERPGREAGTQKPTPKQQDKGRRTCRTWNICPVAGRKEEWF